MEKRYHVFVSSTYEDLKEERQAVIHALLEMDCIPAGMELFPAADEDQWSLIKSVIDNCDYYLVIVGGRYGSVDEKGMGYTEKEYRYAIDKEKRVIGFLHKDPGKLTVEKTDPENRKKLEEFRKLVQQKMCKHWTSSADLGGGVSRSLAKLIKTHPAIGWVRGDQLADKDAMSEVMRLRKKVDELEGELKKVRISPPFGAEKLAQGVEELELKYEFEVGYELNFNSKEYHSLFKTSWNKIFATISPIMIDEASESDLTMHISRHIETSTIQDIKEKFPGMKLDLLVVEQESFQILKVQFLALGLIEKSEKPKRSVKDKSTYWKLTPYGDALMTELLAIPRKKNLNL